MILQEVVDKQLTDSEWIKTILPSREDILQRRIEELENDIRSIMASTNQINAALTFANDDAARQSKSDYLRRITVHGSAAALYGQKMLQDLTEKIAPQVQNITHVICKSL